MAIKLKPYNGKQICMLYEFTVINV